MAVNKYAMSCKASIMFCSVLILMLSLSIVLPSQASDRLWVKSLAKDTLTDDRKVMIIVEFTSPQFSVFPKGQGDSLSLAALNQQQFSQDQYLASKLAGEQYGEISGHYVNANMRTATVSAAQLDILLNDDAITVYENKFHRPALASSVPLIFPDQSSSEYLGEGQSIALLDSGVDKNHSFLAGRINDAVAACFSTTDVSQGLESLCPGGVASTIGAGAGDACDASVLGCEHGTQMAGVIAGNGGANGVAPSALVIPVQIFSQSNDEVVCGGEEFTPCIGALTSDIISALQYVSTIASVNNVAAVNLSLSSTVVYQGECDASEPAGYISAIENLASSDVPVITASGNHGNSNEMSSPACISSTIAVAATDNLDMPWDSNNRNSTLDFFAPGVLVNTSTLPADDFLSVSGTSIAAAHLSGAWSVMKSKNASASLSEVKSAFDDTGVVVSQGVLAKPRIDLTDALSVLADPPPVSEQEEDICFPLNSSGGAVVMLCL